VRTAAVILLLLCVEGVGFTDDPKAVTNDSLPKFIWHAPRPMTSADWVCGPGGCDRRPTPPFQFLKEDGGGTNPKMTVRDARGLEWSIKFGAEAIPECFGSRFATALGYFAEPTYFVAQGKIEGTKNLKATRHVVNKDGSFRHVRFELRGEKDLVFVPHRPWGWTDNPFLGTHELAGLKIVMMLLSNWDAKDAHEGDDSNNNIFRGFVDGAPALLYSVTDWGASLGRWGGLMRRDQSDCSGYTHDDTNFVKHVSGGGIEWGYEGKHSQDVESNLTIDDVHWLLQQLDRIRREDLHTGLKASGATDRQASCWAAAIENRIQQLQAVAR